MGGCSCQDGHCEQMEEKGNSADSTQNVKRWGKELTCDKALSLCVLRADRYKVNGQSCGIAVSLNFSYINIVVSL